MKYLLQAGVLAASLFTATDDAYARSVCNEQSKRAEHCIPKEQREARAQRIHVLCVALLFGTVAGLVLAERRLRRRVAYEQAEAYLAQEANPP